MNTIEWPPRVGAWYLRWDKNEVFQVTGYDAATNKVSIETYAGDAGEFDRLTWDSLSLGVAEPPQDWTAPLETVDVVTFGSAQGDPVSEDVAGPASADR